MTVVYKDYELRASSYHLPDKQKWDARIVIIKIDERGGADTQPLTLKNIFDTEQEAIDNAMITGKLIIDGKHPDFRLPF